MAKKRVGELLRFNVSVPLWPLIVIAALGLIAIFVVAPARREEIKFAATILAGAAAIYSAYYVGAGLRLKIERDRQQASFEILSLLNRPEFAAVRCFLHKAVQEHEKVSDVDLFKKIEDDKELDGAVTVVLGILEDTSIAVQHDYVNEDTLYMSLAGIVRTNYDGLQGYIEQLRKQRSTPGYFLEFEKLAKAWSENRRLSDGRSLPPL